MFSLTSVCWFVFSVMKLFGALRAQHQPHLPSWGLWMTGAGSTCGGLALIAYAATLYARLTPGDVLTGIAGATFVTAGFILIRAAYRRRSGIGATGPQGDAA
jgi:hypothetical protein